MYWYHRENSSSTVSSDRNFFFLLNFRICPLPQMVTSHSMSALVLLSIDTHAFYGFLGCIDEGLIVHCIHFPELHLESLIN